MVRERLCPGFWLAKARGAASAVTEYVQDLLARPLPEAVFLSRWQTLQRIVNEPISVARFGDGEARLILHGTDPDFPGLHFEKGCPDLARRLADVFRTPRSSVLVCYNNQFAQAKTWHVVREYDRKAQRHKRRTSAPEAGDNGVVERPRDHRFYRRSLGLLLRDAATRELGEATCFWLGAYVDEYVDGRLGDVMACFRKLFEGRRVVFAAPRKPRRGPSFRDLVDRGVIASCASVAFVDVPEENAYRHYDEILKAVLAVDDAQAAFLQAGPTATVMAAELGHVHGRVAYDVGTLNVSIEKANTLAGFVF